MATTAVAPAREVRVELERSASRMIEVVGVRGADEYVKRQIALAAIKFNENGALQKCSRESIIAAMIRLCGDRLEVGVTAHLVPMAGQCIYVRDWKGDVELMVRSGSIRSAKPVAVHAGDHFETGIRDGREYVDWAPGAQRGDVIGAFVLATLPRNEWTVEWMTRDEIDAIRKRAPMPDSPLWKHHFAEAAKKTVVHRLAKRMPKSPWMAAVQQGDGEIADGTISPSPASFAAALTDGRGNDGLRPTMQLPAGDPYADHVRADDVEPADLAASPARPTAGGEER